MNQVIFRYDAIDLSERRPLMSNTGIPARRHVLRKLGQISVSTIKTKEGRMTSETPPHGKFPVQREIKYVCNSGQFLLSELLSSEGCGRYDESFVRPFLF